MIFEQNSYLFDKFIPAICINAFVHGLDWIQAMDCSKITRGFSTASILLLHFFEKTIGFFNEFFISLYCWGTERTIWHELVHVSDSINKEAVYWHGDNNLKGKDETAPVKFAAWAANWVL